MEVLLNYEVSNSEVKVIDIYSALIHLRRLTLNRS